MLFNQQSPITRALLQDGQFKKRAAVYVPSFPRIMVLRAMRSRLESMLRVGSQPFYSGEAELFLLFPLYYSLFPEELGSKPNSDPMQIFKGAGSSQSVAYKLAAACALIEQTLKLSNSRDVVNNVNNAGVANQPLLQEIINLRAQTSDISVKESLLLITKFLRNPFSPDFVSTNDGEDTSEVVKRSPLTMLFNTLNGLSASTFKEVNASMWTMLTTHTGKGMGVALRGEDRAARLSMLTQILSAVDEAIAQAELSEKSKPLPNLDVNESSMGGGSDDAGGTEGGSFKTNSLTDEQIITEALTDKALQESNYTKAFTVMYWLTMYLKAVQDYDVAFPCIETAPGTLAFIDTIKQKAVKLRAFYMDVATAIVYYDMLSVSQLWEDTNEFYSEMLTAAPFTKYDEMLQLWRTIKEDVRKESPQFVIDAVETTQAKLKKIVSADLLLPNFVLLKANQSARDLMANIESMAVPTGISALNTNDHSCPETGNYYSRTGIVATLSQVVSAMEIVLAYIARIRQVIRMTDYENFSVNPLIPGGLDWASTDPDPVPASEITYADFRMHDGSQRQYCKYAVVMADGASGRIAHGSWESKWIFDDKLNTLTYLIPELIKQSETRPYDSRVYWDAKTVLNTGDVLTTPYSTQPVLANHTIHRNRNWRERSMVNYLEIMSGHYGLAETKDAFFVQIANIMETGLDSFGRAMATMLAPVMFVYRAKSDEASIGSVVNLKWTAVDPDLPTIYGVPLATFRDLQKTNISGNSLVLPEGKSIPTDTKWITDRITSAGGAPAIENYLKSAKEATQFVNGDFAASVVATPGNKGFAVYLFVLHTKLFSMQTIRRVMVSFAKSSFISVPVLESFWTASSDEVKNTKTIADIVKAGGSDYSKEVVQAIANCTLKPDRYTKIPYAYDAKDTTNLTSGTLAWEPIIGYAPFLLNMPHVLFGVNKTDVSSLEHYKVYAMMSIWTKWSPVEKLFSTIAIADMPIKLWEAEDHFSALSSTDPTPLDEVSITAKSPDEPAKTLDKPVSVQGPGNNVVSPRPDDLAPGAGTHIADSDAKKAMASKVTSAEVVMQAPVPGQGAEINAPGAQTQPVAQPTEAKPGEGSPKPADAPAESVDVKPKQFWKKENEDGDIEDVVMAVECPSGYVPASEKEYVEWTKQHAADPNNKE